MLEQLTRKQIARFWSKVDRSGGDDACWPWQGEPDRDGYGHFTAYWDEKNHRFLAHRVALFLASGVELPPEVLARHNCDNPICVNPSHLVPGTVLENVRDRVDRGRSRYLLGAENPATRISDARAMEIRQRYVHGGIRQSDLASEYGISQAQVSFIVNRKRRSHL